MFHDSVVAKVLERNRGELLLEFQLSDKDLMGFLNSVEACHFLLTSNAMTQHLMPQT